MPDTPHPHTPPVLPARLAGLMLAALACGFTLSQAFRTLAAIMGPPLAGELALSPQQLGLWAAVFHLTFGLMQPAMGVSIDLLGVRRTILAAFPLTVLGAWLSALGGSYGAMLLGQVLIGAGCAPAFLVCTVFIGRHFAPHRFSAVSGLVLSLSGVGVLLTASPMAWLIDASSWRWGFGLLGALALAAWVGMALLVHEPAAHPSSATADAPRATLGQALRELLGLFALPHTAGLIAIAAVAYASFITLRGLWLGPLLIQRHGFSLVQSGHVALLMTLASMLSPALFGRADPGGARRVRWLLGFALASALVLAVMGLLGLAWVDVTLAVALGLLSGFFVLQYGYVRDAYPAHMRGRAMSLYTMAMFLGISLMQWASGLAASLAEKAGGQPFTAALLCMSAMLLLGALAFWRLPQARS